MIDMVKVIGLTGGIGAGKSTVADLAKKNFPVMVISTDDVARQQMMPGGVSYQEVVKEFGTSILQKDGKINRSKLAELIFADEKKVLRLNAITHPNVKTYVLEQIDECHKMNKAKAVIVETALLFNAGFETLCDEVWYVDASEETRRERLKISRGYSDEKITSIFSKQDREGTASQKSNYIIENDLETSQEELLEQLKKLFNLLW